MGRSRFIQSTDCLVRHFLILKRLPERSAFFRKFKALRRNCAKPFLSAFFLKLNYDGAALIDIAFENYAKGSNYGFYDVGGDLAGLIRSFGILTTKGFEGVSYHGSVPPSIIAGFGAARDLSIPNSFVP